MEAELCLNFVSWFFACSSDVFTYVEVELVGEWCERECEIVDVFVRNILRFTSLVIKIGSNSV